MVCRMCKADNLVPFLDMGMHPPSDSFLKEEDLNKTVDLYPLVACLCTNCGLSQLSYSVPPAVLYQQDYPYESSTTAGGRKHYNEFAESVVKMFNLDANDLVIDVGSNVGVLLDGFKSAGTKVLGIDPAPNIAKIANERGIETVCDFFNEESAKKVASKYGKAKVITGTNVFAHVETEEFYKGLEPLLKDDGVFIFESPNMLNLVEHLEYDTIYHEHLMYLSLKPVVKFFESKGMKVFHVEERNIHGGSFRVFICRDSAASYATSEAVAEYLKREEEAGIHTLDKLQEFSKRVEKNKDDLLSLLRDLKSQGKKIAALSAPAKGMSLLNYCLIGTELLDFATEKSKLKIGKFTPGGNIPVLGDEALLEHMPDYVLLLAWNFAAEIMKNNEEYKNRGGKFIIPIPEPRIVE